MSIRNHILIICIIIFYTSQIIPHTKSENDLINKNPKKTEALKEINGNQKKSCFFYSTAKKCSYGLHYLTCAAFYGMIFSYTPFISRKPTYKNWLIWLGTYLTTSFICSHYFSKKTSKTKNA